MRHKSIINYYLTVVTLQKQQILFKKEGEGNNNNANYSVIFFKLLIGIADI